MYTPSIKLIYNPIISSIFILSLYIEFIALISTLPFSNSFKECRLDSVKLLEKSNHDFSDYRKLH